MPYFFVLKCFLIDVFSLELINIHPSTSDLHTLSDCDMWHVDVNGRMEYFCFGIFGALPYVLTSFLRN